MFVCLLFIGVFQVSCSQSADYARIEVSEFISVADQAREDLYSTPTDFSIPLEDSSAAVARIELFFQQLRSQFSPDLASAVRYEKSAGRIDGESQNFIYHIQSSVGSLAVAYRILVQPKYPKLRGSLSQADLNARNLARFIKDGQLEISFLAP